MTADDFWRWWPTARDGVIAELDGHAADGRAVRELLNRAERLGLDCEFAPGRTARHAVCFSCNGNPPVRRQTHRLVQGAPEADDAIEFHPNRIAAADPSAIAVRIEGIAAAIADLRFRIEMDADRGLLDIVIYTPAWPEQVRQTVGFLALDAILGEDEVERWIGEISWGEVPAEESVDAEGLRRAVSALTDILPHEKTWNVLRGTDRDGRRSMVIVQSRLKPIDYPLFDELLQCHIPVPSDSAGHTDLGPAQQAEADLTQRFGSAAFHAASRTYQGTRTVYVYVASDTSTGDEVEQWASQQGFRVERALDPAWNSTRPYR